MSRAALLQQRAMIGIITALPKEFSAVEVMLEAPVPWSAPGQGSGRRYVLGEIPTTDSGTHVVALALLTDTGTNNATYRASKLLEHFPSVSHIIMCGIAGGIPDHSSWDDDIRLGDIVVSDRNGVVNYDFIKQTPDDIQERTPPRPPGAELLEAVLLLEAQQLRFHRPWEPFLDRSRLIENAARPADALGADGKPITYPEDSKRRAGLPRVFRGPIASANRLLKDEAFREALRRRFKTKAVEMEGSGIADAAWLSDRAGYLVVRGVCDFCDMRKGDWWQGYAAIAAAAYVRALIGSMPALENNHPGGHEPRGKPPSKQTAPMAEELKAARQHWADLKKRGASAEDLKQARAELIRTQRLSRAGRLLRVGDVLSGRYELLSPLGQGGFATVWKAFDLESNEDVALKILHHQHVEDHSRWERFFKGAAMMAKLNHPHIVRVLEKNASDGEYHYFVMEYIPGSDLKQQIQQGAIGRERIVPLLCQVSDALQYAHDRGVFHRDVKPGNILIDLRGQAWLTDFDLIKVEDSSWGTGQDPMGSFLYAAPEVLTGAASEANARSDVYSLGMVALFCLNKGFLPVEAFRNSSGFIASLSIPHTVKQVLNRAVQWNPKHRQASVAEFSEALATASTASASSPSDAPRNTRTATEADLTGPLVGVDFGTTSSLVGIFHEGRPVVIPNRLGRKSTPSVVAFLEDGTSVVGEPAVAQAWSNPQHTVFSIKRLLGTDWELSVQGHRYTAVDIASLILEELRKDAERFLDCPVSEAVLTIPAYFSPRQREELYRAATQAGFHVRRMVVESSAAALAVGPVGIDMDKGLIFAVCDLGGGTFDVSILNLGQNVTEVLAVHGNIQLGGDDFDERIVNYLLSALYHKTGLDLSQNPAVRIRIREAAERAKIALSSMRSVKVQVPFLYVAEGMTIHLDEELTRETFELQVRDLLDELLDCCRKAIQDSGYKSGDIERLMLVGLSTRIPLVRQELSQFFGREPRSSVEADEAVVVGASIQAGILKGWQQLRETLLLDVTPRTLSVAWSGDEAMPIIERNTTIPTRKSESFETEEKEFRILMGESAKASECLLIGLMSIERLRGSTTGSIKVEVTFDIDGNSAFGVTAKNEDTGESERLYLHWKPEDPPRTKA